MRSHVALALVAAVVVPSCGNNSTRTTNEHDKTHTADDSTDRDVTTGNREPTMITIDTSPEAWKAAEELAAKESVGELERRSDDLPYMFMADAPAAVLVHKGRVVKEKGVAAAGGYLRDLGIVDNQGPGIEDVLFVLFAFEAWPPVRDVHPEHFINSPDSPDLAELTARIDMETDAAHVVLHYWLPQPEPPPADLENDVGDVEEGYEPPVVRPVARATMVIPTSGDAHWKVETLNWAE